MPGDSPLAGQEANPRRNNIGVINLLFIVDFYLRANFISVPLKWDEFKY